MTSMHSGIRASFDSGDATLTVLGDLDHRSSLVFGALLDIVSLQGYPALVVELGDVNVLEDDVLALIGTVGRRLGEAGGHLTIRSSLALAGRIRRTVGPAGPAGGLDLEPPATDRPLPGAGHRAAVGNLTSAGTTPDHLPSRRRADTAPADMVSLSGALRLLVALTHDTVGGADGVSISLCRHGGLATVASSDQAIVDMDTEQYAAGEGPCVDASTSGHIAHAGPLACEARWSVFTPRAVERGFNSILSVPLMSRSTPVGALNIYSHAETAFSARSHDRASALAYHASVLLDDAGSSVTEDPVPSPTIAALRSRLMIARAEGVLMDRGALTEDGAFEALRNDALRNGRPLREEADAVVASTRTAARRATAPFAGVWDT